MFENTNKAIPIFYDYKNTRWKVFIYLVILVILCFVLIFIGLYKGITGPLDLPLLNLNAPLFYSNPNIKVTSNGNAFKVSKAPVISQNSVPNINNNPNIIKGISSNQIWTFLVTWDDGSLTSFKQNINNINVLIPEWLTLSDSKGNITEIDSASTHTTVSFIQSNKANLKIYPLVNNFNDTTQDYNGNAIAEVLNNPTSRNLLVDNLFNYVKSNNFNGINIDFEEVPQSAKVNLIFFMRDLHKKFSSENYTVTQDIPVGDDNYDIKYLTNNNDYIIPMLYDYHWDTSTNGAIAPQNWYISSLNYIISQVPSNKLIIGLGNYGYDWNTSSGNPADNLTFADAMLKAYINKATIVTDPSTLNPYYNFKDSNNQLHTIWYLDAVTSYNEILTGEYYHPVGFALWRLGSEDPGFWDVVKQKNNPVLLTNSLKNINENMDISYIGSGEITKLAYNTQQGIRAITMDTLTHIITNQNITTIPVDYAFNSWGSSNNKKIALTFDDGPDKTFTPQILDILQKNRVSGTFFIIGNQADLNPGIVKQEYANGNEIGNHTYTHPDISELNPEQLQYELNATQRFVESVVGRRTFLFRPPYGIDATPTTPDELATTKVISNSGYYIVGMDIDPNDWSQPGVQKIVDSVVGDVTSGQGNIILLHDGGGDRTQTVQALPIIISQLKTLGYQFVSVSDLMGIPMSQAMPPVPVSDKALNVLSGLGFKTLGSTIDTVSILFWLGIILGITRLLFLIIMAIIEKIKKYFKKYSINYFPRINILIPAWNEHDVIVNTVNNLLQSNYPDYKIIVIDDGSKDDTYHLLKTNFVSNPKVKLVTKPNGGKSSALNVGLKESDADIIVTQDADTLFKEDALYKLARHFQDKNIGAVAGNVKVGNRSNLLTISQALEYITSQNLDRRAFDLINGISVVPGAVGAWKKEAILHAGGFTSDTLAEDAELTLRILKLGYKVVYDDEAVAFTEAPENINIFIKQRFRWVFGTLQSVWKHLDVLFNIEYWVLGFFTIPNIIIFQILFPLISPLLDIFTVLYIWVSFWQVRTHPDVTMLSINKVLIFYVLFTILDLFTAFVAMSLEIKKDYKLIFFIPIQRLFYKYILYYVSIKSFLMAIKGPIVKWETKTRTANVKIGI